MKKDEEPLYCLCRKVTFGLYAHLWRNRQNLIVFRNRTAEWWLVIARIVRWNGFITNVFSWNRSHVESGIVLHVAVRSRIYQDSRVRRLTSKSSIWQCVQATWNSFSYQFRRLGWIWSVTNWNCLAMVSDRNTMARSSQRLTPRRKEHTRSSETVIACFKRGRRNKLVW